MSVRLVICCSVPPPNLKKFSNIKMCLDNTEVAHIEKIKYLGIILDPTHSFSNHVDYLISKMIRRLQMLSTRRLIIATESRLMLYTTICVPILDYCDNIYDVLSQRDMFSYKNLRMVCCVLLANLASVPQ